MIDPTFYFPYRYEIARKFLIKSWRKYFDLLKKNDKGPSTFYETLFKDYNKELNQDFLSFEFIEGSKFCFEYELHNLMQFINFKNSGSKIYHFDPVLTKSLQLSDILEVKLSNLSFIRESFYLALGYQNLFPLPVYRPIFNIENPAYFIPNFEIQYLDGAYIFPGIENPGIMRITLTTSNPSKDYRHDWHIKRKYSIQEYQHAIIDIDTNEIAFAFSLDLNSGKKVKEILSSGLELDFNIMPYKGDLHYCKLYKTQNEIIIKEVISLIINCIFYIMTNDEIPFNVFTNDIPENLRVSATEARTANELETILSEIVSQGFNNSKYLHGPFKEDFQIKTNYNSAFRFRKGIWKNRLSIPLNKHNDLKWILPNIKLY